MPTENNKIDLKPLEQRDTWADYHCGCRNGGMEEGCQNVCHDPGRCVDGGGRTRKPKRTTITIETEGLPKIIIETTDADFRVNLVDWLSAYPGVEKGNTVIRV